MVLSAMPGIYVKRVCAIGFAGSPRTDIYGVNGENYYNNPFSCESMLMELSNGGIVRISENQMRRLGFARRRVNIGETIKQQVRKYIAIKALKYNVLTKRDCN